MFYHVSLGRGPQPIGCSGSLAQKTAISNFVGLRGERRKNQQSRVERPITDRTVSWSCLGILKVFHPQNQKAQGTYRTTCGCGRMDADGELLARTDLPYKTGESDLCYAHHHLGRYTSSRDDILDVRPATAETSGPQATLFVV